MNLVYNSTPLLFSDNEPRNETDDEIKFFIGIGIFIIIIIFLLALTCYNLVTCIKIFDEIKKISIYKYTEVT